MNAVDVGKFIAFQRTNLTLTQKELAEKLNVTDKAVSKWETGKCYPDTEIIEKLSEIFDVGINEILSGKIIEQAEQVAEAEQNVISVMKYSKKKLNKWKFIALILSLVAMLITICFVININNDIKEHQFLKTTKTIFDSENSMRIDIPEIGLKSVSIRQLEDNIKLTDNDFGTVYLLADNRYDSNSVVADYYLVVSINDKSFRSYVRVISKCIAIDMYRKEKKHIENVADADLTEFYDLSSDEFDDCEMMTLKQAVEAMPESYKYVFILKYCFQYSGAQISAKTGISETSVRQKCMLGKRFVKKFCKGN